jgi:hypothetical protein
VLWPPLRGRGRALCSKRDGPGGVPLGGSGCRHILGRGGAGAAAAAQPIQIAAGHTVVNLSDGISIGLSSDFSCLEVIDHALLSGGLSDPVVDEVA